MSNAIRRSRERGGAGGRHKAALARLHSARVAQSRRRASLPGAGGRRLPLWGGAPPAKKFKRWITHEVLPQIRRTGQYIPPPKGVLPIKAHTQRKVQIEMSKRVNGYQYRRGGKLGCIKYSVKSCVAHTGKTPLAIKEEGKRRNLPSRIRQSAKEVLRALQPEKAC